MADKIFVRGKLATLAHYIARIRRRTPPRGVESGDRRYFEEVSRLSELLGRLEEITRLAELAGLDTSNYAELAKQIKRAYGIWR